MRAKLKAETFPMVSFPKKLECLFQPSRYKVVYGGRGGGKSWSLARALLIQGAQQKLRVLCAREFQNSIADSVHQLLSDQIGQMGLSGHYKIGEKKIEGRNGSKFRFFGLRKQFNEVKSYEGIDRCWVEEATTVSGASWDKLIPTIRKDNSEIWISFNPELEKDETYQRFVLKKTNDMLVVKMNYYDNPWFNEELKKEMAKDRMTSEDKFLYVWEGFCRRILDGAVFAAEMRDAELGNRITNVPMMRGVPVDTFWDIGRRDMTSIWFRQQVGFEFHYIDFHEDFGHDGTHYLKMLQDKGYVYGMHYLPHDAANEQFTARLSFEGQAREALGNDKIDIVESTKTLDQLNAARSILPRCYFDQNACADGLQHLRHWCYRVDEHTKQYSPDPKHDEHSHASKAFIYSALRSGYTRTRPKLELDAPKVRRPQLQLGQLNNDAWMS